MITSRQNEFVKRVASLKEKKYRRLYGEYVAEGAKQVREAVAAGKEISCIVVSSAYAGERPEGCVEVSAEVFSKLSGEAAPQGILAVLKLREPPFAPPAGKCLLLDGVSDPGNLGTIVRTANAAGYEDIYLLGCTDPYAPKCVRAAMSGHFFVRLHAAPSLDALTGEGGPLAGLPLICADMGGEDVFSFSPPRRFALVIGNEADGVSAAVRERCAYTVRVPMRPCCESLNAAVSAGILMYALAGRGA